ncbi:hypothetical protein EMIT0P4_80192 [Pseudomonas sp. IT-P4]
MLFFKQFLTSLALPASSQLEPAKEIDGKARENRSVHTVAATIRMIKLLSSLLLACSSALDRHWVTVTGQFEAARQPAR